MKSSLLGLVVFVFIFSSCAKDESANVNQDSIYTIYELFYNEEQDKTTAQATFRFGGQTGTLLDLSDPAVVTFNGDELNYRPVLGVHNKEYSGWVKSGTYVYLDIDENDFMNTTVEMDSIGFMNIDTIDANSAFTFVWLGNSIGSNETIALTIDGSQQNNFEFFASSAEGSDELILAANKLKRLGAGDAVCTLVRTNNRENVDEGTSEGGRMAVWYTAKRNIYIQQ